MAKRNKRRRRCRRWAVAAVLLLLLTALGGMVRAMQNMARPAAQPVDTPADIRATKKTTTTTTTTIITTTTTANYRTADGVRIPAEYVSQAGFPTGCESASAVMLLRFFGVEMDMETFIDEHLDCGAIGWGEGGMEAPHPAAQFVGDPRSSAAYGCYAPVIVRALADCLPSGLRAVDESGATLLELCARYLDCGAPVMVWATIGMKPVYDGNRWTVSGTGERFTWPAGEHCLLLTGYDDERYYFNDPYQSRGAVSYPRALVEARFVEMGQQAVAVAAK